MEDKTNEARIIETEGEGTEEKKSERGKEERV